MGGLTLRLALRLGRVSNLPTVWSNVIAGMVLAGVAAPGLSILLIVLIACSLMYVGGMFLNDAYDAGIDSKERAERPIPNGEIARNSVFAWGFGMLAAGVLLLLLCSGSAALAGLLLAAAIILYDWHHKANPFSPLIMGVCRMLVYAVAAYAVVTYPDISVFWGAAVLLCYLIGLTYVAKQENLRELRNMWPLVFLLVPFIYIPLNSAGAMALVLVAAFAAWTLFALSFLRPQSRNIPRTVVSLIAGISLLDASLVAMTGALVPALFAVCCFAATLVGQRYVSGT